jgi:hypothetical protein
MKISTQTKKHMLKSRILKSEVFTNFQDGRRRHDGTSSECYKMGSYHLILTKIGKQTKKSTLSLKIIKAEVHGHFQDGSRGFFGNSSAC